MTPNTRPVAILPGLWIIGEKLVEEAHNPLIPTIRYPNIDLSCIPRTADSPHQAIVRSASNARLSQGNPWNRIAPSTNSFEEPMTFNPDSVLVRERSGADQATLHNTIVISFSYALK